MGRKAPVNARGLCFTSHRTIFVRGDDVLMTGWVGRLATDIAPAVRSGEVTAAEVVADHLDRIVRLNAELGAFVRVRASEAADEGVAVDARADRSDLPLASVPVAVMDTVPVAGEPMRLGSAAMPDTPLVARRAERSRRRR